MAWSQGQLESVNLKHCHHGKKPGNYRLYLSLPCLLLPKNLGWTPMTCCVLLCNEKMSWGLVHAPLLDVYTCFLRSTPILCMRQLLIQKIEQKSEELHLQSNGFQSLVHWAWQAWSCVEWIWTLTGTEHLWIKIWHWLTVGCDFDVTTISWNNSLQHLVSLHQLPL